MHNELWIRTREGVGNFYQLSFPEFDVNVF